MTMTTIIMHRKTHTMEGPTLRDEDMQGVIPRMVDKLFSAIADQDEDIAFTICVSYFEVCYLLLIIV